MAEAATSSNAAEDATRGKPYYEKLRKDLKATLDKKRELDKTMATVEQSIARAENSYLEETSSAGNIIKGFDNYIKASTSTGGGGTSGGGTATRRKAGVSDQDKIFSRSSVSWMMRDSPAPLANNSATPSEGATPAATSTSARNTPASTAGGGPTTKVGTKKKKPPTDKDKDKVKVKDKDKNKDKDVDKESADGDSERPAKRGKITWGRD